MNNYNSIYKLNKTISLSIKREDYNGNTISGNKLRKLKYNIIEAKRLGINKIVTFGGAFSNHIHAVSYLSLNYGFEVVGIIRGEELIHKIDDNSTLSKARENGMKFHFVSREEYKRRNDKAYHDFLKQKIGDFYLIPEGGTNDLAIRGCEEILEQADFNYDYVCCPVGTGGTISGIINASQKHQEIIGFSALKGDFLKEDISKFVTKNNWSINTDYHFGGYAKINAELITFINKFKTKYNIPLDPIYTGKMLYGINDLILKGYFKPNSKILAIHTGGLQGIEGINQKLRQKKLPLLL